MVVWSSTIRSIAQPSLTNILSKPGAIQAICKNVAIQVRHGGHGPRMMEIQPSRFQWNKFKDNLHFYTLVGAIPCIAIIFITNVFIGPAQLTPIPEGYDPKHWEYHRHPISRFMSRYIFPTPQQDYEKTLHVLYVENEKKQLRFLEEKVENLMKERRDYQAYYYRPVTAKNLRVSRAATDFLESLWGDN
ncbi:NADH dehydrogenase [ubiquinone] 1 beta subcomplex subunit 5, mitochondrial isoform X2 [Sitodiplosis mosellana]|uniref:NADH dehydrogenase [ubiquinone] 1 beta subcomplex subunit 5, mitochondrial isoform X2 n=1 Tax=Sitodiplosis mosellana TaxID=263140 RepID=UPI0024448C44|nr:NADH dehydrogenase [ubiquinone] 1 beta subcomplex subunit 5, mitochondrial isoform X2 [Sitodiplosis mosellana]